MKKTICFVLLLFALVTAFSGCNKNSGGGKNDTSSMKNILITDKEGVTEVDLQAVAEMGQKQLDNMYDHLSEVMTFKVSVKKKNIVFACSYQIDIEDTETLKTDLEKGTQKMHSWYTEFANNLYYAGCRDTAVIIEYYTNDGELVFTKDYKYTPQNW